MALFFSGRTSNGTSPPVKWHGGEGTFYVHGLFDGGTVTLQASFDGGTAWVGVGPDVTFTVAGAGKFRLGACHLRATLTGATSPDVTAGI